jgi:hypothetical protein
VLHVYIFSFLLFCFFFFFFFFFLILHIIWEEALAFVLRAREEKEIDSWTYSMCSYA